MNHYQLLHYQLLSRKEAAAYFKVSLEVFESLGRKMFIPYTSRSLGISFYLKMELDKRKDEFEIAYRQWRDQNMPTKTKEG